jgi:glucose/arabinose dehydrogenase/cytochrome c2
LFFGLASGLGFRARARTAADGEAVLKSPMAWGDFVETNFPFFSSVFDGRTLGGGLPAGNLTPRGIILNLGSGCWACFDTDLLRMSAVWTGRPLTPVSMSQISYHSPGTKAVEGQEILPQPMGTPWLATGIYPGWQAASSLTLTDPREPGPDQREVGRGPLPPALGRFKGLRLTRSGVAMEYEAEGAGVREWMEARMVDGKPVVQRRFQLDRIPQPLVLILGRRSAALPDGLALEVRSDGAEQKFLPVLQEEPDGLLTVRIPVSEQPVEFRVAFGLTPTVRSWGKPADQAGDGPPKARWAEVLTTRGEVTARQEPRPGEQNREAYVVDNIPLPLENPWKRNIRLADLAFFHDGRAVAVTFDGDVWMISGLNGDLGEVKWRRFASGLHEPLGLCVRDEQVYVFDRNGIWRLRDTDGNGEADAYELFSSAFAQTAETREFATGIKLAPGGSFVIAKGGIEMATLGKHNGSVLRVSADGKSATVLGRGFREPFIGVNPETGLVTASDQQGHYVPSTPLDVVRDGQFYGFLSVLQPKEKYPAPIADPLTWIPYPVNASGAGQVWLAGARMGPLNGALIHLGYYRPEAFLVLLNQRQPRLQATVLSLTRDFKFAPLNGAVNPVDGQLYVTGFQIFGSDARQISGLARVRYTGVPSRLPREVVPMDKGVLVRFDTELDAHAVNPASFSAERWKYVRTFNYGSAHYKTDGSKGQDAMVPSSAYLSRDGKSVFVGIPDMRPVMQMRLGWALAARDGARFEQNAYFTPYELSRFDPSAEGFEALAVDLKPRTLAATKPAPVSAGEGKRLAELLGCAACHSADGSTLGKVGPSWKGLFGSEVAFAGGGKGVADEAYLRESIKTPSAKIVRGYEKSDVGMPVYEGLISDSQIESLILHIKTLR